MGVSFVANADIPHDLPTRSTDVLLGSIAESVGRRTVEKAAPWKSPNAGLFPFA